MAKNKPFLTFHINPISIRNEIQISDRKIKSSIFHKIILLSNKYKSITNESQKRTRLYNFIYLDIVYDPTATTKYVHKKAPTSKSKEDSGSGDEWIDECSF